MNVYECFVSHVAETRGAVWTMELDEVLHVTRLFGCVTHIGLCVTQNQTLLFADLTH